MKGASSANWSGAIGATGEAVAVIVIVTVTVIVICEFYMRANNVCDLCFCILILVFLSDPLFVR